MANSAGDWGSSNPMNMPDFIRALRTRGHDEATIRKVVYDNPLQFFSQAKRFNFHRRDERER
jgi:predicted metal-dependent TIM-barrel fold hydrolase